MTASEAIVDEAAFSDVSSVCEEDLGRGPGTLASNCSLRFLSRAKIKERFEMREEVRRKHMEEVRRKEEDRKEREREASEAKNEVSDNVSTGSGFSDVSGDAADVADSADVQLADEGPEGPDLTDLKGLREDAEDLDVDAEKCSGPCLGDGSDFGSSTGSDDLDWGFRPTSTVLIQSDDRTRVELRVQASQDGPQDHDAQRRVVVRIRDDWAPLAAERFLDLVEAGFYRGTCFHRVVKGTLAQFGLPAEPGLYKRWKSKLLKDDDKATKVGNSRGTMAFAEKGQGTRCCQVFINLCHNKSFDHQGFTPFAEVVQGMDSIDDLFDGYGELPPKGTGPEPERIKEKGSDYLVQFPKLSSIASAKVLSRSGDIIVSPCLKPPTLTEFPSISSIATDTEIEKRSTSKSVSRVSFSDQVARSTCADASQESPHRTASPAGSGLAAVNSLRSS